VLARACWTLRRDELDAFTQPEGAARFGAVRALRDALGLPRWIALGDGDQELPIDLDSALAIDTLAQLVKGRSAARLVELFPGEDALCARGPEGAFTHEIILPLTRRATLPSPPSRVLPAPPRRAQRVFAPGSEWLFMKLYAGSATLDRVLVEVVAPAADRALASGAADRWFFIRYADPGPHLRVRLHGDPARLWGEVFPDLARAAQPFVDEDRIATVVLDTYDREIDRYGGVEGIDLAEQIFWADSEAVAGIVAGLVGAEGASEARWRIAVAGIDRLLGDLGLDAEGKRVALARAREGSGRRFAVDTRLGRQLGERYRKERAALEPLLDVANDASSPLQPALALLRCRSERMAPFTAELLALERAGRLSRPVAELAGSFIHMFANRLFRGAANEQELVVHDLLARLHVSRHARGI
jgi:thiopeptide-type bacteriocin biosynthesis protein